MTNSAPVSFIKRRLRRFDPLGFGWSVVRAVILAGLCFLILYPFFVKAVNGFKSLDDFLDSTVRYIPKEPTWDNWFTAFDRMEYLSSLGRTLMVSVLGGVLQTFISSLVGYGFARFKFKGNGILFACVILVLLVPPQTILIPLYETFRFFIIPGLFPNGMINTVAPMIILSLTGLGLRNGLYIFMFRQSFRNMPKELEEAAYIDGCGAFGTFFKIMLPSARPIIVTVSLFAFSWQWTDTFYNDLFFPTQTVLASAVYKLQNVYDEAILNSMLQNVGAILAILPLAIFYLFAQRAFVQSVERSGIVG
ncbi:MAG: carbohydrate ABC transporter permease [Clostridia bacterium]|nr:carbohydrate ABC transporter permease [Clostridia bacterium]